MKIYTKTGDDGNTSLFGGQRVAKDSARVEAYGTVDELNSYIGLLRTYDLPELAENWLEDGQQKLFIIGSDLATPLDTKADWLVRLNEDAISSLEQQIDLMTEQLEPLKNFILPGGTQSAATAHVARTICRRAERRCVELAHHEDINPNTIIYLNRLSDFLFTMARWINFMNGESEQKWSVRS